MGEKTWNMKIDSTTLGVEDHGIMTAYLHLVGDGCGQGFGGYSLDQWSNEAGKRVSHVAMGHFVARVLETVGVEKWEQLPGKYVRIKRDDKGGWGGPIIAIGHITDNKWFDAHEEMAALVNP